MGVDDAGSIGRYACRIVQHEQLGGQLYLLHLHAPEIAQSAKPGHFVQVDCGPVCTVPRPLSLFSVDALTGSVVLFYRVVGKGTQALSESLVGATLVLLGPLGHPFTLNSSAPVEGQSVLIAGGIGLAPLYFLALSLADQGKRPVLFWGIEEELPFPVVRSNDPCLGISAENDLALAAFERRGITSRLSSLSKRAGLFHGYVTDLADRYLSACSADALRGMQIFTCGPTPMMRAVAILAEKFGLSGEASLEEHMACGFGGCAGCVAKIHNHYRRVCLEGPVFSLSSIRWLD